ncbi:MAG: hypothetical protein ACRETN_06485 [Nevskiales bacterium]
MSPAPVLPGALPRVLLIGGLLLGIAAAAVGVLRDGGRNALPPQAIAQVNERLILRDAWLRAVAAVASERRTPLTEDDKRHILDRLIDEELLVQHGVALGLIEQDRRLRGQLVSDVIATATAAEAGSALEENELRRFYADNKNFFTPPGRIRVAVYRLGAAGARSAFVPPVPDVLLPPAKLRTYLGPALTQTAMQLQPGQSSAQIENGGSPVVVEMLEHEPGFAPLYEQVAEQVRAEYQRRRDEVALRRLLAELRDSGRVLVREELE